jgi:hypothetical protein
LLCLAHTQRRSVSSAEAPVLPPYMHPETPHDVPCPLEMPVTRMAPGNVGSCRGGIKGSTFSRSSQYLPACRSSSRCVFPLSVLFSTQLNLKGYSQPSPTSYLLCTLLLAHCRRQATYLTFAPSLASHLSHLHQQGPSSPDPVSQSQASSIRITILASLAL